jgi:thiosulfate/3-mercaptopyruvate sulfurtransferase
MTSYFAARGTIEPGDLKCMMDAGEVKLMDATYGLPGAYESFLKSRIGNAVFFDIDVVADPQALLPHTMPSASDFEKHMSGMGISNHDKIVVYGQNGMVMGPARAWWMLRAFGHLEVCVLNGGLPAWIAAGFGMNNAPYAMPITAIYKSSPRPELLKSMTDMKSALNDSSVQILDARPAARFDGIMPEPRPGMRSGHMPGACNAPAMDFIDLKTGKLLPDDLIRSALTKAKFDPAKTVYTTCGSGVTACVVALGLYAIGHKNAAVYDGSWTEWGADASAPVTAK